MKRLALACAALLLPAAALAQSAASAVPENARFYLSQGEWLGSALSAGGRAIIKDVAHAAAGAPVASIDINGLADLAGSETTQRRLSVARANAVLAELVNDGVAERDIAVEAYGAPGTAPPGRAAPGPQGHRVVIIVHY